MSHLQLALVTGLVVGLLNIFPMMAGRIVGRSCIAAFILYFFASIIVFYSDLPYLPWWADGPGVTLMMTIPMLFSFVGRDRRSTPIVLLNALIFGFLISVSERFLG